MGDSVSSTSGNQPAQGAQPKVKKTKKQSLRDWANSIFAQEFKQIDTNGNGIDSVDEAKKFVDWCNSKWKTATDKLKEVIVPKGKLNDFTEKVVKIWSELSEEHHKKAEQLIKEDEQRKKAGSSESAPSQRKSVKKKAKSTETSESAGTGSSRKSTYQQARELYEQVQEKTEDVPPEVVAGEMKKKWDPLKRVSQEDAAAYGKAKKAALDEQRRYEEQSLKEMGIIDLTKNRGS